MRAPLVACLLLAVPLAGCLDIFGSDEPALVVGRTVEVRLEVSPSSSGTIELYTMNDGGKMRSVAIGFEDPDDPGLRVPNPAIRLVEGDTLILTVANNNPLPHTFHLHGGLVPWDMDGVPFLNQIPIMTGEEFVYTFPNLKAGTYFYHCHVDVAHHMDLGMYGSFIVDEREPDFDTDEDYVLMLDEWDNCHVHGNRDPVDNSESNQAVFQRGECMQRFVQDYTGQGTLTRPPQDLCDAAPPAAQEQIGCNAHGQTPPGKTPRGWYPIDFPVYAPEYNTYLINGKAYPDTAPVVVDAGDTVRLRFVNVGEEMHSMHLHGHSMLVTHRDGYPLSAPFRLDTLGIMPGERYDVIVEADNPGFWALHDHVGLHVMNDHQAPGGMFTCFAYDGFSWHGSPRFDARAFETALECNTAAMQIFGGGHM